MEAHPCLFRGLDKLSQVSWKHRSVLHSCLLSSYCWKNKSLLHFHPTKHPHSQVSLPAQMEPLHTEKQIYLKRNIQWFHTWSLQTKAWFFSRLRPYDGQAKTDRGRLQKEVKKQASKRKKKQQHVIKQISPSTPTREAARATVAHNPTFARWVTRLVPNSSTHHHSAHLNHEH